MADGYRTARAWLDMRKDGHAALHNFVYSDSFKTLWSILKKHDGPDGLGYAYSPVNGGVPRRLLSAIETWHKAPKFTVSERRLHSKRIAKACTDLEDLLGQLVPSNELDDQYEWFRFSDEGQAGAVLAAFHMSVDEIKAKGFPTVSWIASQRLRACGVVPLWAVQNIKIMALDASPKSNGLPTKVRATAAKKTFFIGVVNAAICRSTMATLEQLSIGPQLIADVVGLLSDLDCTADDVRKAADRD